MRRARALCSVPDTVRRALSTLRRRRFCRVDKRSASTIAPGVGTLPVGGPKFGIAGRGQIVGLLALLEGGDPFRSCVAPEGATGLQQLRLRHRHDGEQHAVAQVEVRQDSGVPVDLQGRPVQPRQDQNEREKARLVPYVEV